MNRHQVVQSIQFFMDHEHEQQVDVFDLIHNVQSEIQYYKNALANAEKLIQFYKEQNNSIKKQNISLADKCKSVENQLKQLMRKLIKHQEVKSRQIQMISHIELLKDKLSSNQKTIEILEGKLLILNLAIKKQEYAHKYSQLASNVEKHIRNQNKFFANNRDDLQSLRVKKRNTTSTYQSSATRLTDLRRKNEDLKNSRFQTEGANDSQTTSRKFYLDPLQKDN